mgnify:FL=1
MYFWGLSVDIVTAIILVLAVGLSVDYASHIGHSFMLISGKRSGRSHHESDFQQFYLKGAHKVTEEEIERHNTHNRREILLSSFHFN